MLQSNRPSSFMPVFSSSTQETNIFLAINNFLKTLQAISRTRKIELLKERDISLTPNAHNHINNLISYASQEEIFSLLNISDFDEEPWLYQVLYSIIVHYNNLIFDKISENLSNLNNNPDIIINLCQNELWQSSNSLSILMEISLTSEFCVKLFINILEYYKQLLAQKSSFHFINVTSNITQQLLIRVSNLRLKDENKTQCSELMLNKVNELIQFVANQRMLLNPPKKEKHYKPRTESLSEGGKQFIAKMLNVLSDSTDVTTKLNRLSSLSDRVEELSSIPLSDKQIIKDLFYIMGFSLRSPKDFTFIDQAHPTIGLLSAYYFYERFYKCLPDRLQIDVDKVKLQFQQLCNMFAKSFAGIIEEMFGAQLISLNENQKELKSSSFVKNYNIPTLEKIRNINAETIGDIPNILFALTVEQAASLDMIPQKIDEKLCLLENLLITMPEFFVRYPQVFNRYENLQKQCFLYIITKDESSRIIYQANLRKIMEEIDNQMQNSSPQSQENVGPIFLRLNELLMESVKKATRKRTVIELIAHKEWALERGHIEYNRHVPPHIAGWYSKVITQIEENELWSECLQETNSIKLKPDAALDALYKVDISILDSALKDRLKNIFSSLFRLQLKIDPMIFCADEVHYETFFNVTVSFHKLLKNNKQQGEDETEYLNLLQGFIAHTIMRLMQKLLNNLSQEQAESKRVENFIVDLIALLARLFKPGDEIAFIMNWYVKLEYIFPSQKFLFDKFNSLLAEFSPDPAELLLNAKQTRCFKPI